MKLGKLPFYPLNYTRIRRRDSKARGGIAGPSLAHRAIMRPSPAADPRFFMSHPPADQPPRRAIRSYVGARRLALAAARAGGTGVRPCCPTAPNAATSPRRSHRARPLVTDRLRHGRRHRADTLREPTRTSASRCTCPASARCCSASRNVASPMRIVQHDAVEVLRDMVAPARWRACTSSSRPRHKKRHHKRRLIQPAFVALLASRSHPAATCTARPTGSPMPSRC